MLAQSRAHSPVTGDALVHLAMSSSLSRCKGSKQSCSRETELPSNGSAGGCGLKLLGCAVMCKYLKRVSGFGSLKDWESALDRVALLMITVEQTAGESGRTGLSWLLTLQPDPPSSIFLNHQSLPTSSWHPFAPLPDQRLIASAFVCVKEPDTLSTKSSASKVLLPRLLQARRAANSPCCPTSRSARKHGQKRKWHPPSKVECLTCTFLGVPAAQLAPLRRNSLSGNGPQPFLGCFWPLQPRFLGSLLGRSNSAGDVNMPPLTTIFPLLVPSPGCFEAGFPLNSSTRTKAGLHAQLLDRLLHLSVMALMPTSAMCLFQVCRGIQMSFTASESF